MKKCFKNFCHEKSWEVGGGGGLQQPRCPEREGVAAKINKFPNFHFIIFSFCHNNDYVPEILET